MQIKMLKMKKKKWKNVSWWIKSCTDDTNEFDHWKCEFGFLSAELKMTFKVKLIDLLAGVKLNENFSLWNRMNITLNWIVKKFKRIL